uniref:Transposase n=2 Tax=Bursaphelenchus xylophilus TaxID=6326 RepID=A0A1I7SP94_BURXY
MSEARSYPLPKSLCQFDSARPTRLSDVQRILEADKELRRLTGFSPLTADFR